MYQIFAFRLQNYYIFLNYGRKTKYFIAFYVFMYVSNPFLTTSLSPSE